MTKVPHQELGEGRLGSVPQSLVALAQGEQGLFGLLWCFVCFCVMASKTLDLLGDGRNLRIRIAVSDLTVS